MNAPDIWRNAARGPLAMLGFLIDARNWPADPDPFKITNVILPLVDGALLAWLLWKLGKALAPKHFAPALEVHNVVIPEPPAASPQAESGIQLFALTARIKTGFRVPSPMKPAMAPE